MLGVQKGSPATAVAGRGLAAESAGPSLGQELGLQSSWRARAESCKGGTGCLMLAGPVCLDRNNRRGTGGSRRGLEEGSD